jgi:hypothetical protein
MAEFYYKKRKNYPAARVFYNEAITVAPNSDTASTAGERLEEIETKSVALREKQAEWLMKQMEKAQKANAKKRGSSPPPPQPNPTEATIESPPDGSAAPQSAPSTAPAPEPVPTETDQSAYDASEEEEAKPKKKFLGIF